MRSVHVKPLSFFAFLLPGLEDVPSIFLLPRSKAFAPRSDQRLLGILEPILSTSYGSIFLDKYR